MSKKERKTKNEMTILFDPITSLPFVEVVVCSKENGIHRMKMDPEDVALLGKNSVSVWQLVSKKRLAIGHTPCYYTITTQKSKAVYIHSLIAANRELTNTKFVGADRIDHLNGDPMDNRKSNLAWSDAAKNRQNNNSPGICWQTKTNRWRAQLTVAKKRYNLGTFKDRNDAWEARRQGEILYFQNTRKPASMPSAMKASLLAKQAAQILRAV